MQGEVRGGRRASSGTGLEVGKVGEAELPGADVPTCLGLARPTCTHVADARAP